MKVFAADEEKEEPLVHRRSSVCVALDATKDLASQLDTMDPAGSVLIHGHELGVQQAKDMLKVCRWKRRLSLVHAKATNNTTGNTKQKHLGKTLGASRLLTGSVDQTKRERNLSVTQPLFVGSEPKTVDQGA